VADRQVSVALSADISRFQRALATAAAEAQAFGRSVDGIDGSLKKTETQSARTGNEIDKLSGRLRVLADLALIAGPALGPLGAGAIGGMVALSAQLGATATAIGVTVLAVNGLGDGLKALDTYQLKPTAENLVKLQQEMKKLGPAGENFVRFLDSIEPNLKTLQYAAREGLLPGVQEGIENLLPLLPRVRSLIRGIANELGDLSAETGAALAGDKFAGFFEYLKTDAVPLLDDTARTAGNLAEAVANLFVAFGGVSTDFSGGLLKFSQGLADASENLDSNAGFQEFLDYIETEGPHAVDTLASVGDALLQIVEATAPLGGPVLSVIKAFADAIAAIADSDLGTPIFTGLAALALYNRALAVTGSVGKTSFGQILLGQREVTAGFAPATTAVRTFGTDLLAVGRYGRLATEESARLQTNVGRLGRGAGVLGGLALAGSGLADSMGLSNTASLALMGTIGGPWGAAIGGAAGYALDFRDANGKATESIQQFNLALQASQGDLLAQQNAIDAFREQARAMADDLDSDSVGEFFKNAFDPDVAVAFTREAFGMKTGADQVAEAADKAQAAHDRQAEAEKRVAEGATAAVGPLRFIRIASEQNAEAAQKETAALNGAIQAMHDMRTEALRAANAELDYQQSIDDATAAVKKNGRTHDETTQKGRDNLRALYNLAGAWDSQSEVIKGNSKLLAAARENFIKVAESMGISAGQARKLSRDLFDIPEKRVIVVAMPGIDNAINKAQGLKAMLDSLHSKDINIALHYQTIGNKPHAPLPGGQPSADGGTVPKTGGGYMDRHAYLLADGEEVVSNRHGQADRHRSLLKAINAGRMADGGTTGAFNVAGGGSAANVWHVVGGSNVWHEVTTAAGGAASALKALKAALAASEKALDKEKQTRDDLQSQFDSIASSVGGAYSKADPFAAASGSVWGTQSDPLSMFDTALASNTKDTQAAQMALAFAQSHGLDGPLYAALAASGNLPLLQSFAQLSSAQIDQREQAFAAQSAAQSGLGAMAAQSEVGTQLAAANKELVHLREEVKGLRRDVKEADKNNQKASKDNAQDVYHAVNGAASNGHRRGR
jgi:hypothetical protein